MKKIIIILVTLSFLAYLGTGCFLEDETCQGDEIEASDETTVESTIEAVEDDINEDVSGGDSYDGYYTGFMAHMHPCSDYYDGSFVASDLHNYGQSDYDFDTAGASFSGSEIILDATIDGLSGYNTRFVMKQDGGEWKVVRWYEDGNSMYKNIQPPQ